MPKSVAYKEWLYYTEHIRRSVLMWHKGKELMSERRDYEDISD